MRWRFDSGEIGLLCGCECFRGGFCCPRMFFLRIQWFMFRIPLLMRSFNQVLLFPACFMISVSQQVIFTSALSSSKFCGVEWLLTVIFLFVHMQLEGETHSRVCYFPFFSFSFPYMVGFFDNFAVHSNFHIYPLGWISAGAKQALCSYLLCNFSIMAMHISFHTHVFTCRILLL